MIAKLYVLRLTSVNILQLLLFPNKTSTLKLSPFGTCDVIGHVTIGFTIYGFYMGSVGVTTSTFCDHVTSSVTWPLVSYRWSI